MRRMKKLLKKFETAMMAVAFAEEGEFDTARQLLNEGSIRKTTRMDKHSRVSERKELRAE